MQRNWSLTSLPIAILAFTMMLVSASSSAQAQGETFDNIPDWLAAITGTPTDALSSATILAPNTTCIELDPSQGQLEGYLIKTANVAPPIVSLFDGDTLVGTINHDSSPLFLDVFAFAFGFVNTDGLNVTKIVIEDNSPSPPSISCVDVSFTPNDVAPPAETCFDQLADVKAEVEALLATSTGKDAHLLASVVDCICWTQHDCFWVQPSGDRLTAYGSNVFLGNAYSIAYLEHVSDPQADVIIDQLLDTLECLVDREIEYAIANGGREANIDKAMDFADLADVIDDEFDNQVVSSLAYKLAWVNAYYATY